MWWGLAQEPNLRRWYTEHTGLPCIPDGWLYRSREFPFLGATPDGWTMLPGGLCIPVELKTANAYAEEDWSNGVPAYYMPQVQQQMLVLGAVKARVVVCFGGNHGAWIEVERDPEVCERIVAEAREFWRKVNENERPDPDGSESCAAALSALFPLDPQAPPVELGQAGVTWTDRLEEIDASLATLNAERDTLRQNITAEIGSSSRGILPGGLGSWTLRRGKGGGLRRSKK
jgi:predicted phage-related endonuclease